MSAAEYNVDVSPRPEAEGGGFIAVVPQLPECNATGNATGNTPEQAAGKAIDAIKKVLAARAVSA